MKLSREILKEFILEEIQKVLNEVSPPQGSENLTSLIKRSRKKLKSLRSTYDEVEIRSDKANKEYMKIDPSSNRAYKLDRFIEKLNHKYLSPLLDAIADEEARLKKLKSDLKDKDSDISLDPKTVHGHSKTSKRAGQAAKAPKKKRRIRWRRCGKILKYGCYGNNVRKLQQDLVKLGYKKLLAPRGGRPDDGKYGGNTYRAVKAFQKKSFTARREHDGRFGDKTSMAMKSELHLRRSGTTKVGQAALRTAVSGGFVPSRIPAIIATAKKMIKGASLYIKNSAEEAKRDPKLAKKFKEIRITLKQIKALALDQDAASILRRNASQRVNLRSAMKELSSLMP